MKLKRFIVFLFILSLLSIFSYFYPALTGEAAKTEIKAYPLEEAALLRAIDGDTIEARLKDENSTIMKVRMLGINTPEKKMPFSNESKNFLKQFENKTIILERDWEDEDKYYRKLRYVFYEGENLNLKILEKGLANIYYYSNLKYEEQIINAEKQAREAGIGIWTKSMEKCAVQNCIYLKNFNLTAEFFVIENICNFSCSLEGWFVKDAGRNTFKLSSMNAGEEKTYNSPEGKEVWNNNGDRFFIFDEKGFLVLFYEHP